MFSTVKSGMFSLKIAGNQRIERVLIMAGTDFIPASDEGFRTYANNFASNISADPGLYMLSVAQAASIQTAVDQFDAAFVTANNELTRTKPTITAQDNARSIAETMIRQYAAMIKPNTGITDDTVTREGSNRVAIIRGGRSGSANQIRGLMRGL